MAHKQSGACIYCGQQGVMTADDVVPRCLFLSPRPGDIPRVPACAACNNQTKSLDDSYLRDVLVCDFDTQRHPIAQQVFAKFIDAINNTQGKNGRRVQQSALPEHVMRSRGQNVRMFTPGGIYVGSGYGVQLPPGRIENTLVRMVQGLHYAYLQAPFPQQAQTEVQRIRNIPMIMPVLEHLLRQGAQYRKIGDGRVFMCIYGQDSTDPNKSLWFLNFYENVVFSAAVNL